jgi:hypothetical protein
VMPDSRLPALVGVIVGVLIYVFTLLVMGGMTADELLAIPVIGRRAAILAERLGKGRGNNAK